MHKNYATRRENLYFEVKTHETYRSWIFNLPQVGKSMMKLEMLFILIYD